MLRHLELAEKSYWLARLCEENFAKMLALVPWLPEIDQAATAYVAGKPTLHLRVLERSPYTLTLELTHRFCEPVSTHFEPAVQLRIYFDARAVEVLGDKDRPGIFSSSFQGRFPEPQRVLDHKWTLNYFLSRWLDHCAANRYNFVSVNEADMSVSPAAA